MLRAAERGVSKHGDLSHSFYLEDAKCSNRSICIIWDQGHRDRAQQKKDAVWNADVALWAAQIRRLQWIETMQFFSRFGYLVAVFFLVSAFIAGAIGTAYHLSLESTSVLFFLFWGFACLLAARRLDRTKVKSSLVWLTMEHWGYLILILAILDTYANWASLSRDWTAVS